MMISTKGRYALRVMMDLAEHVADGYISLKEISARQGVSMKYLEMIVSLLNKGGVVKSLRGSSGGYCLARPAKEISVYEIFRLTEGDLAPVACLKNEPCDKAEHCRTLPLWENLDMVINDYLSGVSVEDLITGNIKKLRESVDKPILG